MEQTFFMIKPDGVKRGFIGEVISRIERRGFSIDRLEVRYADADILKRHYAELTDRPFFPTLVDYMTSGPVTSNHWSYFGRRGHFNLAHHDGEY